MNYLMTKRFIITQGDIAEILAAIRQRNYRAVQKKFMLLEEIKEDAPGSEPDRNAGKKGRASQD